MQEWRSLKNGGCREFYMGWEINYTWAGRRTLHGLGDELCMGLGKEFAWEWAGNCKGPASRARWGGWVVHSTGFTEGPGSFITGALMAGHSGAKLASCLMAGHNRAQLVVWGTNYKGFLCLTGHCLLRRPTR